MSEIEALKNNSIKQKINIFLSRYFKYLIIAIVFLAILVGYFYFFKPKYNETLIEISESRMAQEGECNDLNLYYDRLVQYIKEYNKIKAEDIEKARKMIPENYNHEELFTDFEAIIKGQGFLLNSLSINSEKIDASKNNAKTDTFVNSAGVGKIKINAQISGVDYKNLLNLLDVFENNLRLMDVESLKWSPSGSSLDLEIVTYYLRS
ncbi:MAG: hypothetical protein U9R06_01290 [Patescibacteria group bacterium]|nr:hypothetical protein [Patescibacteria group bacterium]